MNTIKSCIEFSLLDWPGKISTVIFLPGCNFRCPFCHNHDLVLKPESLEGVSIDAVLERCRERSEWIDGIVVSGGEPTIHSWLPVLLRMIKDSGFEVKLDTNGSRPQVLLNLLSEGLVDHIAMDVKAPLTENLYSSMAGVPVDMEAIHLSIDTIITSGIPYTFRTTVIPGMLAEPELLRLAGNLSGSNGLYLQKFNPENALDPTWRSMKNLPDQEIFRLNKLVNQKIALPTL